MLMRRRGDAPVAPVMPPMQAMSPGICVKRSPMGDGKFLFDLKKQKPAGVALPAAIVPGLMTGSSQLFTNPTKTNKHYYAVGQERIWRDNRGTGRVGARISNVKEWTREGLWRTCIRQTEAAVETVAGFSATSCAHCAKAVIGRRIFGRPQGC